MTQSADRLIVSRGLFEGPNFRVPSELYTRGMRGRCRTERHMLHLGHGATANTDTYFGRFPASYFQRWTTATSVEMRLTFDAEGPRCCCFVARTPVVPIG